MSADRPELSQPVPKVMLTLPGGSASQPTGRALDAFSTAELVAGEPPLTAPGNERELLATVGAAPTRATCPGKLEAGRCRTMGIRRHDAVQA